MNISTYFLPLDSSGGKRSKDSIYAMVATNLTGDEKFKLLVVRNYKKKSKAFKNIKLLAIAKHSNSKAWMIGEIF